MRVNCKKSQVVCVSPSNGYVTSAAVGSGAEEILSQPTMKLLGFMIGSNGGMHDQIAAVKLKFRKYFWTLINLCRAGIAGLLLFKIYKSLVRPILETNSVIFHHMLGAVQAEELEKLQRMVIRLAFGRPCPTSALIEQYQIPLLKESSGCQEVRGKNHRLKSKVRGQVV